MTTNTPPASTPARDLCNGCDANPANPSDPAGYCDECRYVDEVPAQRGEPVDASNDLPTGADLVDLLDQSGDEPLVITCTDPECGRMARFDTDSGHWVHTTRRALPCFAIPAEPYEIDTVGADTPAEVAYALAAAGIEVDTFRASSHLLLGIGPMPLDDASTAFRILVTTAEGAEDFTGVVGGVAGVTAISGYGA
jgi:hypothetical protein